MQQRQQCEIDFAVMEQISEFSRRTKTFAPDLINHVLRVWLDVEGAAALVSLGLEPMTPRFDGTAGYGSGRLQIPHDLAEGVLPTGKVFA
jgi:hypothetical protein